MYSVQMLNAIKLKPLLTARTQLGSGRSQGASGRPPSGLLWAALKLSLSIKGGLSLLVLSTLAHSLYSLCPCSEARSSEKTNWDCYTQVQPNLLWALSEAKFSRVSITRWPDLSPHHFQVKGTLCYPPSFGPFSSNLGLIFHNRLCLVVAK